MFNKDITDILVTFRFKTLLSLISVLVASCVLVISSYNSLAKSISLNSINNSSIRQELRETKVAIKELNLFFDKQIKIIENQITKDLKDKQTIIEFKDNLNIIRQNYNTSYYNTIL